MMHRIIRDHLEEILAGPGSAPDHPAGQHLADCAACREVIGGMREQSGILRQWRVREEGEEAEPRAGFYARVLERIESQRPTSVFALFFDSQFAHRIAMASLALALLLGVYVISSEQMAEQPATLVVDQSNQGYAMPQDFAGVFDDGPARLVSGAPDQNAVLVNLVTYREQ